MLKITPIPAFENNYFWAIQHPANPGVILVDPGDAAPVLAYLQNHQLRLEAILITHRHRDHIGGIDELLAHYPVEVYGPKSEAIPQVSRCLGDGDTLELIGTYCKVIAVPGHTWEHIAYYIPEELALFCGDTLFAGGCGRRFDGTAETQWASLQKLACLPDDTLLYCAHEYTLANLRFAIAVEPENAALAERLSQVEQLRQQGQITIPSNLALEKRTNPFLRCHEHGVKVFSQSRSGKEIKTPAEVFEVLRSLKDTWPSDE